MRLALLLWTFSSRASNRYDILSIKVRTFAVWQGAPAYSLAIIEDIGGKVSLMVFHSAHLILERFQYHITSPVVID